MDEGGEGDDLAGPSMQTECSGCNDLTLLTEALKEKCALTKSRREKVQILTLVPASWTIQFTAQEFKVNRYLVKKKIQTA